MEVLLTADPSSPRIKAPFLLWTSLFPTSVMMMMMMMVVVIACRMPEAQQRVGGCFLNLMPQMKTLYLAYCANHPSAVSVLTEHRLRGLCALLRPRGSDGARSACSSEPASEA
ncbi:hypothetical protein J1605_009379 [Eschrichtius robustus]|uniref:Uncharacterized protein n=1 Tax=Eschrichtius robustus TaxID=9764 RepID=A0AB34GS55_ESCRO|nr:hypothetical protein J1605_009379 [Eschrichtius robustus]